MIITDEARDLLKQLMEEEHKDCLTIEINDCACHSQLIVDFTWEANPTHIINGLPVKMSQQVAEKLSNTTINVKNGKLTFKDTNSCAGCNKDCQDCNGDC